MDFPKRGDIWLVSLEPVVGHEIGNVKMVGVKTHLVVPYVKKSDDVKVVTVYPCRNINKEIGNKEAKRWVRVK